MLQLAAFSWSTRQSPPMGWYFIFFVALVRHAGELQAHLTTHASKAQRAEWDEVLGGWRRRRIGRWRRERSDSGRSEIGSPSPLIELVAKAGSLFLLAQWLPTRG